MPGGGLRTHTKEPDFESGANSATGLVLKGTRKGLYLSIGRKSNYKEQEISTVFLNPRR